MTTDSWEKSATHVISELKRFSDEMREMRTEGRENCKLLNEKIDNLQKQEVNNRIDVATLNVKVALIGMISATVVSVLISVLTK